MKYYAPVLTVVRFISVAFICFYGYVLIYVLAAALLGPAPIEGMERAIEISRSQAIKESMSNIVIGFVLYLFGPLLSRVITLGSDSR